MPRGAGRVRNRSFAAQFVEAIPLPVIFITKGCGKPAGIEVGTTRTVFMDGAVISELGTIKLIQRRESSHGYVFQYHRQQVVRIWRATGQIDERLAGDDGIDSHRAGRIRSEEHTS